MINLLRASHAPLFILILAAVTGCGGGGGGDSSSVVGGAAPTAASSAVVTDEDVPNQGSLNASDPENDPLTYMIVSNGSVGTATVTNAATGAFVYTPDQDAHGTDTFGFKASDGASDSNTATVTVTIVAVNDAPVAQAGSLATNSDTVGSGTLVAIDAESQPLTYSIVSNGSQGNVTLTEPATGAFVYAPDPNSSSGTDSFTFRANDGLLDSNVATVAITINGTPIATGGCSTTPQAQRIAGTLNATDPETPALLMYSLNADGSGGMGPITTSKGGIVTITDQTAGDFTYQPDTAAGDKRGADSFDYQVTDPDGGATSATETIIVDQTIMPLGDSITMGTITATTPPLGLSVGYRKPLYDTLRAAGFTFDFVGSANDGNAVPDFDFDSEGHGGWQASEIAWGQTGYPTDGVRAWLDANPSDIVLLHAGTNGLTPDTDIDIAVILDEIDQWEGSANGNPVTVVLAKIIDWVPHNPDVDAFNAKLQSMANARIANGDDIIVVDQQSALNYVDDMGDSLHPNERGYPKMSAVWFNALRNLVDKCP